MELRRGRPDDLSFVYRLEKRYIEEVESDQLVRWQESIERHLDQWVASLPRMTIAQSEGIRIGYVFWDRQGEEAVVASVSVDPSHRRKGAASYLLKTFESDARSAGYAVAKLGVVHHNPARQLYEKLGYQETGATERYVMMSKPL